MFVSPRGPTLPAPDPSARIRVLEAANAALCDVICESAPLAWVAGGDADAAHRWERKAVAVVKTAQLDADSVPRGYWDRLVAALRAMPPLPPEEPGNDPELPYLDTPPVSSK